MCMYVYVYMILILFFYKEYNANYTIFFVTHFSICHSFLDFLYMAFSRHSE